MHFLLKASSALVAGALAFVLSAPTAQALTSEQQKCQETVAKEGGKFLKAVLKEKTKCADKNLQTTGSCDLAGRDEKIDKAESKLRSALSKKCGPDTFGGGLNVANSLKTIGFPGKCSDPLLSNGFTDLDLGDCIFDTHLDIVNALYDLEYGANGADGVMDFETQTGNPDTAKLLQGCQKEIGKGGVKLVQTVQKEISKCRNALEKGSLSGFLPVDCADNPIETGPAEKIDKAVSKGKEKIQDKCTTANILLLDVCDTGGGPAMTNLAAANCIADTHVQAIDDPDNTGLQSPFPTDAIDIEYHLVAVCGDNIVNDPLQAVIGSLQLGEPNEECDGTDDSACDGFCGGPTSNFPCLCTDVPRQRVIEHDNSDLDNGWTGTSHDSTVVEGGGYMVDLYDCDGPGGPDVLCTVGPSCTVGDGFDVHAPCVSDANCGLAGPCRKSGIALGPHCNLNVQTPCTSNANCPGQGNFCRKTPHGIPLPLSSGGVAVCVVNIFSEDVTGTTNLTTGSSAVRLRQDSRTHLASGTLNLPCPTCGFFCEAPLGAQSAGPGGRTICATDADCFGTPTPGQPGNCITDAICSHGENQDLACRRDPPFGNASVLFGVPSVDCSPNSLIIGNLDILFNPTTTGTLTTTPSFVCNAPGSDTSKCILGSEVGSTCIADSDCTAGGAGSCQGQCFCPPLGGTPERGNGCFDACRGGSNDYDPCGADSDCPGGFCEAAACRLTVGVCVSGTTIGLTCAADSDCAGGGKCGDPDSSAEGFCPSGPAEGLCSHSTFKGCALDSECWHSCVGGSNPGAFCQAQSDCTGGGNCSGGCPQCLDDNSETCIFSNKNCFVSSGYTRTGTPGTPDRVGVAHYCIPASSSSAVNSTAGVPGPGGLEQPATTVDTF